MDIIISGASVVVFQLLPQGGHPGLNDADDLPSRADYSFRVVDIPFRTEDGKKVDSVLALGLPWDNNISNVEKTVRDEMMNEEKTASYTGVGSKSRRT